VSPSPAGQREPEACRLCRMIRVPLVLDKFFRPWERPFHWNHCTYFRLLVVTIAWMWGWRHGANVYRDLELPSHRTRVHNFFLVGRWDPKAVLRQQAQEVLQALHPQPGATLYLVADGSQKAKRGPCMGAVAKLKAPVADPSIQGHQYVCAMVVCRDQVIAWGIRLHAKPQPAKALGRPFRKPTELVAHLGRELKAPLGVKVSVLFDADSLCHPVVQACRAQGFR
jgi:hypothetical protein